MMSLKVSTEAVTGGVLSKNVFLEISQNSQENTCARVSFLIKLQETLAQVFCCKFCEISKNTFSTEHLRTTAPVSSFIISSNRAGDGGFRNYITLIRRTASMFSKFLISDSTFV